MHTLMMTDAHMYALVIPEAIMETPAERLLLEMELDMRATVSVLPERIFQQQLQHLDWKPVSIQLNTYGGQGLPVLGQEMDNAQVEIELDWWETRGVIYPVMRSDWATPLVCMENANWEGEGGGVEVTYLGHVIDRTEVGPSDKLLRVIKEAPEITNKEELRAYCGLLNYYGQFIPQLSSKLSAFYELLKLNVPWDYIYGDKFILEMDHKPLTAIFGEWWGVPPMAAFEDFALSPVSGFTETTKYFAPIMDKPLLLADIGRATNWDSILARVKDFTTCGWPECNPDESVSPYFTKRTELTRLNYQIEDVLRSCHCCQSVQSSAIKKVPLHQWSWPTGKWQCIHVEFVLVGDRDLLVVVDAHSKWVEGFLIHYTMAEANEAKL
ncbi:hypothetical protein PR048_025908 [Dryococelus australis]|uniref:Reverse transcriptase RNase H-like domain-containing protein n=1 Tax=Dryococelus australis TaxID=614101 RepID=A0ABQ9GJY1_9NEOP|nr:hypothetical protein PR048_025908 [Dryococelus australis]